MWTLKKCPPTLYIVFWCEQYRMILRMILRKFGRATHCGLCQPYMGVLFGLKERSQEDDFQERMKALTLPGLLGEETPELQ